MYKFWKNFQFQFNNLLRNFSPTPNDASRQPESVPNFVRNLSTQVFSEKELHLLNFGLNFCPPSTTPHDEIIVDIETAIKPCSFVEKQVIRHSTMKALESSNIYDSGSATKKRQSKDYHNTLALLRAKDCFYMKADKGNSLVIMDKCEYNEWSIYRVEREPVTENDC